MNQLLIALLRIIAGVKLRVFIVLREMEKERIVVKLQTVMWQLYDCHRIESTMIKIKKKIVVTSFTNRKSVTDDNLSILNNDSSLI